LSPEIGYVTILKATHDVDNGVNDASLPASDYRLLLFSKKNIRTKS